MTTDVKELLRPHMDLPKASIQEKIKSGEIVVPKGSQRDEFFRLATMEPEARKLEFEPVTPDADKVEKGDEDNTEVTPVEPEQKKWYEELGYESAEMAMEGHKTLVEQNRKYEVDIDTFNSKLGKRGTELNSLRKEVETLTRERDEWKSKANPAPDKPSIPDPSSYEEGVVDENYIADMRTYAQQKEVYDEYRFNKRIEELESKLEKKPEPKTDEPENPNAESWDKFWNELETELQDKYNLTTSVPARKISDALIRMDSDPDARKFIEDLPREDMDKYAKLEKVAKAGYAFTDNGPVLKYKKFSTMLDDNDFLGEGKLIGDVKPSSMTSDERKSAIEDQQRKIGDSVTPPNAETSAGADNTLSGTMTTDEMKSRYKKLLDKYQLATNAGEQQRISFEGSEEFTEYMELGVKLGFRKPRPVKR